MATVPRGLLTVVCLLAGAGLTVALIGCQEKELFQAPEKGATAHAMPRSSDSIVTLSARMSYADLRQAIIDKASTPVQLQGSQRLFCADIPHVVGGHISSHQACTDVPYVDFRGAGMQRQCINVPDFTGPSIGMSTECSDFNWHAAISREGNPTVAKSGSAVLVELPIRVDGQGGLSGDLPKLFSLSAKNVEAHLVPGVALTFDLDDHWCPITHAAPTSRWVSSAAVEVIGRSCIGIDLGPLGHPQVCVGPSSIDLTGQANDAVSHSQSDLVRTIQTALSCDQVRNAVAAQWHPFAIPIPAIAGNAAFFNITPTGAAFSGLVAEDDGIRLAVQMHATTQLATTAVQTSSTVLPPLGHIEASGSRATLHVPAIVPYDLMTRLLQDCLKGHSFDKNTSAGQVTVHVEDVVVYPSKEALAVGLKIAATLPGRWLDTKGWVYLVGQPTIGNSGKTVEIRDLHYGVVLDSAFWEVAADLFKSTILHELNKNASIDITQLLAKAGEEVKNSVNAQKQPGVLLTANAVDITAESAETDQDGFIATARLDMAFDIALTNAILLHK